MLEKTVAGQIYRTAMALLDLERPWKVLRRGEEWIFGSQADYERLGDVGDVVFATGAIVKKKLYLYYSAADDKVAVAIADMDQIKEYILSCPEV